MASSHSKSRNERKQSVECLWTLGSHETLGIIMLLDERSEESNSLFPEDEIDDFVCPRVGITNDLFDVCWKGNLNSARLMVEENPDLVRAVDDSEFGDGFHPIHYAVYAGHFELVELLILKGANLNAETSAGVTPLFFAAQQGHQKIVQFLLQKGAKASTVDHIYGLSAIDVAASEEIANFMKSFCDSGSSIIVPKRPEALCEKYGFLRVSWEAPPQGDRALPIMNFVVQVLRVKDDVSDSSEEEQEEDEQASVSGGSMISKKSVRPGTVVEEKKVRASARKAVFNCRHPFPVGVRVAAETNEGIGEWTELSEPILCVSVPKILNAPKVSKLSRDSIKIEWEKAKNNGSKIQAYRVEGAEFGKKEVEFEQIVTVGSSIRSHVLERVPTGKSFRFRIVCANACGKSRPGPPSIVIKS